MRRSGRKPVRECNAVALVCAPLWASLLFGLVCCSTKQVSVCALLPKRVPVMLHSVPQIHSRGSRTRHHRHRSHHHRHRAPTDARRCLQWRERHKHRPPRHCHSPTRCLTSCSTHHLHQQRTLRQSKLQHTSQSEESAMWVGEGRCTGRSGQGGEGQTAALDGQAVDKQHCMGGWGGLTLMGIPAPLLASIGPMECISASAGKDGS